MGDAQNGDAQNGDNRETGADIQANGRTGPDLKPMVSELVWSPSTCLSCFMLI